MQESTAFCSIQMRCRRLDRFRSMWMRCISICSAASGHKLNGPKGIGFLYIRKGVKIRSFIHGGAQERKRRAGTENVPGIVGLGKAVELAVATMEERIRERNRSFRDYLIGRIESEIPYCRLNGDRTERLPNNVNFSFRFVEGESLLIMLDMKGICASSGSACTSGSLGPVPCTSCHWSASRDCTRFTAYDTWCMRQQKKIWTMRLTQIERDCGTVCEACLRFMRTL